MCIWVCDMCLCVRGSQGWVCVRDAYLLCTCEYVCCVCVRVCDIRVSHASAVCLYIFIRACDTCIYGSVCRVSVCLCVMRVSVCPCM